MVHDVAKALPPVPTIPEHAPKVETIVKASTVTESAVHTPPDQIRHHAKQPYEEKDVRPREKIVELSGGDDAAKNGEEDDDDIGPEDSITQVMLRDFQTNAPVK